MFGQTHRIEAQSVGEDRLFDHVGVDAVGAVALVRVVRGQLNAELHRLIVAEAAVNRHTPGMDNDTYRSDFGFPQHVLFDTDRARRVLGNRWFFVGTAGALAILVFYKVLGGFWFEEGETSLFRHQSRRRRRRRYRSVVDE